MKGMCILLIVAAVIAFSEAGICPDITDDTKVLVPDEKSCHKFYKCEKGSGPQLVECPSDEDGLQCFDKTKRICTKRESTSDCCQNDPDDPNGDCPCDANNKCKKMYYEDANVKICVK